MNSDTVKKLLMKIKGAERALEKKIEALENNLGAKIKNNFDSIEQLKLKLKERTHEITGLEHQVALRETDF